MEVDFKDDRNKTMREHCTKRIFFGSREDLARCVGSLLGCCAQHWIFIESNRLFLDVSLSALESCVPRAGVVWFDRDPREHPGLVPNAPLPPVPPF